MSNTRKRVFVNYTPVEYANVDSVSKEYGMSLSRLNSYFVTLNIGLPKTTNLGKAAIDRKLSDYLDSISAGSTFICSTPFVDEWAFFTTSCKRSCIAAINKLVKENKIGVVPPTNNCHSLNIYSKIWC